MILQGKWWDIESVRRKGREKRGPQEGKKKTKAKVAKIIAIIKNMYVAFMVCKALLHNLFRLIFTTAL